MRTLAVISRGETFRWSLAPRQVGETARAVLKAGMSPNPALPEAAVATVTEATIEGGPGWTFTLTAAQTAALTEPAYVVDERIAMANGDVQITEPALIMVEGSVTGPAS